jgi:hypothetical protein
MSTLTYQIDPGKGPNLDRIADSFRYFLDSDTTVEVTFYATRHHDPINGEGYDVPIVVSGEVYEVSYTVEGCVKVHFTVIENGRCLFNVHCVAHYNYRDRTGQLGWIIN